MSSSLDSSRSVHFLALRRRAVSTSTRTVYGLDYVSIAGREGQWMSVWLHFIQPSGFARGRRDAVPPDLSTSNLLLTLAAGDQPARAIIERLIYPKAVPAAPDQAHLPSNVLAAEIRLAPAETLDTFQLQLIGVPYLDPFFSSALFSCRVDVPSPLPLPPPEEEPVDLPAPPLINYLAKDYDTFLTLISDRMFQMVPEFTERNPTAQSVGLMELLAYAGDYLSYRQDAVGTEAYLQTCRQRISLQRHCQMLDYLLSQGNTARVWVQISTAGSAPEGGAGHLLAKGTQVLTKVTSLPRRLEPPWQSPQAKELFQKALQQGTLVFETMADKTIFPHYEQIPLYTWGVQSFQLDRGATSATLDGAWPYLAPGEVVILQQSVDIDGPTGRPKLAQAVRLTSVRLTRDPVNQEPITEIQWMDEDALTADLPVAKRGTHQALSVVLGNLVLADFGRTVPIVSPRAVERVGAGEPLPRVPPDLTYYPRLLLSDLTFAAPIDASGPLPPARWTLTPDPLAAQPQIRLFQHALLLDSADLEIAVDGLSKSDSAEVKSARLGPWPGSAGTDSGEAGDAGCRRVTVPWSVREQLLNSGPWSRDFVVEIDDSRQVFLRFGNGCQGRRPEVGSWFTAVYRIGSGTVGNIGSNALGHIVSDQKWITGVSNPLAADGGVDAQTTADAKLDAPGAYLLNQPRCVTSDDFVTLAERSPEVFEAVAEIENTGSWRTAFVYVRRQVGLETDPLFIERVSSSLSGCLMAGTDLKVSAGRQLALDIGLRVVVEPDADPRTVYRTLMGRFSDALVSNPAEPDSGPGFFYPGRLHMGRPLDLSRIVAHAAAAPGVAWVEPIRFQPWARPQDSGLDQGWIQPRLFEVVRVANDPTIPANGSIDFEMVQ